MEQTLQQPKRSNALVCFWPETAEELVDYGIEEVTFLLDHFQDVLEM